MLSRHGRFRGQDCWQTAALAPDTVQASQCHTESILLLVYIQNQQQKWGDSFALLDRVPASVSSSDIPLNDSDGTYPGRMQTIDVVREQVRMLCETGHWYGLA